MGKSLLATVIPIALTSLSRPLYCASPKSHHLCYEALNDIDVGVRVVRQGALYVPDDVWRFLEEPKVFLGLLILGVG